jgi:adenylate cyclase
VFKLTLNRVFVLSLAGLLAGLAILFWLIFYGLQEALLKSSEQARDRDSEVIAASVSEYLNHAPGAVAKFESFLNAGLVNTHDPESLRNALLTLLIHNGDISEATFTFANPKGRDANGNLQVDPASVGQVALFRSQQGPFYVHRYTWWANGVYFSTHGRIAADGKETEVEKPVAVTSPAEHATFKSPILDRLYGQIIPTDLEYFPIDPAAEGIHRRVEVSVQKAIDSPDHQFLGVLRIGLFTGAIDRSISNPLAVDTTTHSIFICDNQGRLVAPSGATHYIETGKDQRDLRLSTDGVAPQILTALNLRRLQDVDDSGREFSDKFQLNGQTWLCTFRGLPETQDWIVGMVVPEAVYLGPLWHIRAEVIWGAVGLALLIAIFGSAILYAVSAAHSVILKEAGLMNDFILSPSANKCNFQDINRVLRSIERAKTAMRAMGKYVPVDLVRRLYHRGEEPRLGGETTELAVLFTDIENFTGFAEPRDADDVATHLGAYLDVLASVIQQQKGTIDKFIGDSVMAFWNAPEPVPDYPALACRAALEGRTALEHLYQTPAWEGLPPFGTRFGLHNCSASVGHFGSPDRFNYTAIGDGINLASRLQSLNKHYGTTIIASAGMRAAAGPGFNWRKLDRVAVKGKTQGIDIYELLGEAGAPIPDHVAIYEQALEKYFEGDFQSALSLVENQPTDRPSAELAIRCRQYLAEPPAENWEGVYVFETK